MMDFALILHDGFCINNDELEGGGNNQTYVRPAEVDVDCALPQPLAAVLF